MGEMQYVTLVEWARKAFSKPPAIATLRDLVREGRFDPPAIKEGRSYKVHPNVKLVNCEVPPAPARPTSSPRTALYRYFDASGRLLYVGISKNAIIRHSQHWATAQWTREIARMDVEWLPTRKEAEEAEVQAIRTEKPLHNVKDAIRQ